MPSQVQLDNVGYSFNGEKVLSRVSFMVEPGQTIVMMGKSGSGKSILLEICAGLKEPSKGYVSWDNKNITDYARSEMVSERRKTGFVFQQHALISNMSVFDNIALPLRYHTTLPDKKLHVMIRNHLETYGIIELQKKLPEALSVGQSRIVAIARALIMRPELLFLDEPISGLDPIMAQKIFNILIKLSKQSNLTILIVNHTINLIERLQCPILFLHNKKVSYYEGLRNLRDAEGASEFISYMGGTED